MTDNNDTMPDRVWVGKYPHVKTGQGHNVYQCFDHTEGEGVEYTRAVVAKDEAQKTLNEIKFDGYSMELSLEHYETIRKLLKAAAK
jgi:hypothetical protein